MRVAAATAANQPTSQPALLYTGRIPSAGAGLGACSSTTNSGARCSSIALAPSPCRRLIACAPGLPAGTRTMAAAAASKIAVANPVVDLDGDEMTRWGRQQALGMPPHVAHVLQCSGFLADMGGCRLLAAGAWMLAWPDAAPACCACCTRCRVIWNQIKEKVGRPCAASCCLGVHGRRLCSQGRP